MSENQKQVEQEPKIDKQKVEINDIAQELSNIEMENVKGGGIFGPPRRDKRRLC